MKELDKRMFKWLTLRLESTPPNPMDYKEFHEWRKAKELDEKFLKYIEDRFECLDSDVYSFIEDASKKYKEELKEKHNLSNLSDFELEALKEVCECELWSRSLINNSANNTSPNIEPINEQKGEEL